MMANKDYGDFIPVFRHSFPAFKSLGPLVALDSKDTRVMEKGSSVLGNATSYGSSFTVRCLDKK
jgi:hypothetical protein